MAAGEEFELRAIAPSDQRRMEAGIFNYGNDMDITNNPFEMTGLERLVELDNDNEFVSRAALERIRTEGVRRKLVGVSDRRRAARHVARGLLAGRRGRQSRGRPARERVVLAAAGVQHGLRVGADRAGRRGDAASRSTRPTAR